MTMETWKKEFYPISAKELVCNKNATWLECAKHSLKKWEGALPENLMKHDIMYGYGDSIVSPGRLKDKNWLIFNGNSCTLCEKSEKLEKHVKYMLENNVEDFNSCESCPLYKHLGSTECYNYQEIEGTHFSLFSDFLLEGNPKPMIRALRKLVEEMEAGNIKGGLNNEED